MQENASISTLKRLPFYLDVLKKKRQQGEQYISSSQIAKELDLNDVQVRKDLATASKLGGKPKVGYEIDELIDDIYSYLGCNRIDKAVLVGVGSLGRALLGYNGFGDYGLKIIESFDSYSSIVGSEIHGVKVSSMNKLEDTIKAENVRIGIITVPANVAQDVCNQLVKAGCKAIWNFAPTKLSVPNDVVIQNENMASSLAILSRHLNGKN